MVSELYQIISAEEDVHVLELSLPVTIDVIDFDRLNEGVQAALAGKTGAGWVLDLSRVTYMGSAVLGLMVNIRQQVIKGQGRLMLCGLSDRLLQIFRTSCMERLFIIAKTRRDALEAMSE